MRKKNKFLKEKIFYTSLGVLVILLSLVSVSYAFTETSVIGGITNPDTIPNVTFDKTDVFTLNNNTEVIDLVLDTPRSTTCTFDMVLYFYDSDKYIKSDDNKINVNVYDSFNDVLSTTLESSNSNNYSKIGSYSINADGTTTKNISFDISYNGIDNYNGYITLENVICTTD